MYKIVCNEIVSILNDSSWNGPILDIHLPQRAKFERYLQSVLASRLKKKFADTQIEYPLGNKHVDIYANRTYIELKTPNTNYRLQGIEDKSRPITNNIEGVIEDIEKLRLLKEKGKDGVVAFVLFPIDSDRDDYLQHVEKIISALRNNSYCQEVVGNMFVFSCKV